MKKSIFVCAACLTMVSIYVHAQNKETNPQAPLTPVGYLVAPAPPPAPPPPPPPPLPQRLSIIKDVDAVPPIPPIPPVPPVSEKAAFTLPVVNSIGYDISVHLVKAEEIVVVKKNGIIQRIKMSTWLADRKYYEKKYGVLSPPPPPIEKAEFTSPLLKKDS